MADQAIGDLDFATTPLEGPELFVLQQNGAKKIEAQTFIAFLANALDGHGGIASITYTEPEPHSLVGTLTIAPVNGQPYSFPVTNGRGISSITWTSSGTPGDGMIHTGTIEYNDDSEPSTVQFQDGVKGPAGTQTQVWIRYADDYPTADSQMHTAVGPVIGIYTGTAPDPPTSYDAYTWYRFKGEQGDPGDYIENVLSYGNSSAAGTEPSTWFASPTSISYSAGNYIWRKTEYVMHGTQTVQATRKEIIGYIGQNGSGSGTVTQITFNGAVFHDNGAGNVNMTVEADDVGAIANPQNKSNGQVLTYDSTAGAWVAATPSTGSVNTVNNVGPTAGTTNVQLYATTIPMSSTDNTSVANSIPQASNVLPSGLGTASAGSGAGFSRPDHVHPMPSASDVGAVSTSDVQYKIYDSVTDLGLDYGSATISGAWTVLTANAPAILICNASGFASGQVPGAGGGYSGTIEMVSVGLSVGQSTNRGWIDFKSYSESAGDYRMYVNGGSPTGTWVKVTDSNAFTLETVTVFSSAAIAAGGYNSATVSITKSGYKPLAISGVNASGTGAGGCLIASYYFTDSNTKAYARVRNVGTSAATITCTVDILYVKI